jgi:hypothetical protein
VGGVLWIIKMDMAVAGVCTTYGEHDHIIRTTKHAVSRRVNTY